MAAAEVEPPPAPELLGDAGASQGPPSSASQQEQHSVPVTPASSSSNTELTEEDLRAWAPEVHKELQTRLHLEEFDCFRKSEGGGAFSAEAYARFLKSSALQAVPDTELVKEKPASALRSFNNYKLVDEFHISEWGLKDFSDSERWLLIITILWTKLDLMYKKLEERAKHDLHNDLDKDKEKAEAHLRAHWNLTRKQRTCIMNMLNQIEIVGARWKALVDVSRLIEASQQGEEVTGELKKAVETAVAQGALALRSAENILTQREKFIPKRATVAGEATDAATRQKPLKPSTPPDPAKEARKARAAKFTVDLTKLRRGAPKSSVKKETESGSESGPAPAAPPARAPSEGDGKARPLAMPPPRWKGSGTPPDEDEGMPPVSQPAPPTPAVDRAPEAPGQPERPADSPDLPRGGRRHAATSTIKRRWKHKLKEAEERERAASEVQRDLLRDLSDAAGPSCSRSTSAAGKHEAAASSSQAAATYESDDSCGSDPDEGRPAAGQPAAGAAPRKPSPRPEAAPPRAPVSPKLPPCGRNAAAYEAPTPTPKPARAAAAAAAARSPTPSRVQPPRVAKSPSPAAPRGGRAGRGGRGGRATEAPAGSRGKRGGRAAAPAEAPTKKRRAWTARRGGKTVAEVEREEKAEPSSEAETEEAAADAEQPAPSPPARHLRQRKPQPAAERRPSEAEGEAEKSASSSSSSCSAASSSSSESESERPAPKRRTRSAAKAAEADEEKEAASKEKVKAPQEKKKRKKRAAAAAEAEAAENGASQAPAPKKARKKRAPKVEEAKEGAEAEAKPKKKRQRKEAKEGEAGEAKPAKKPRRVSVPKPRRPRGPAPSEEKGSYRPNMYVLKMKSRVGKGQLGVRWRRPKSKPGRPAGAWRGDGQDVSALFGDQADDLYELLRKAPQAPAASSSRRTAAGPSSSSSSNDRQRAEEAEAAVSSLFEQEAREYSREALGRVARAVFGFPQLRDGQYEVIARVLAGRSTLAVLPTGGGKTLCYMLPAVVHGVHEQLREREGRPGERSYVLVVSPLVALMQDQLANLPIALGGAMLDHYNTPEEEREVFERLAGGQARVLFASCERVTSERFLRRATEAGFPRPRLACVDEAHLISDWGHNFRPCYLALGVALRRLGVPTTVALTATATRRVEAEVCATLGIEAEGGVVRRPLQRPNLLLTASFVDTDARRCETLLDLLASPRLRGKSVIVYAAYKWHVELLSGVLADRGVHVAAYTGDMPAKTRRQVLADFRNGTLQVVVATVAFGMGIDKRDLGAVVHWSLPRSPEAYLQEVGRAGRDGRDADGHVFLREADYVLLRSLAACDGVDAEPTIAAFLASLFDPGPLADAYPRVAGLSKTAVPSAFGMKAETAATLLEYLTQAASPPIAETLPAGGIRGHISLAPGASLPFLRDRFPVVRAAAPAVADGASFVFSLVHAANEAGLDLEAAAEQLRGLQREKQLTFRREEDGLVVRLLRAPEAGELARLARRLGERVAAFERSAIGRLDCLYDMLRSAAVPMEAACRPRVPSESGQEEPAECGGRAKQSAELQARLDEYMTAPEPAGPPPPSTAPAYSPPLPVRGATAVDRADVIDALHAAQRMGLPRPPPRAVARAFHGLSGPGDERGACPPWAARFFKKGAHVDFNDLALHAASALPSYPYSLPRAPAR